MNLNSIEETNQAKVIGGDPTGEINFTDTNHKWAVQIYDNMEARTWKPSQVDIIKDISNYRKLNAAEKRTYDLLLGQLIVNDSLQASQLMEDFISYVTSPVVRAVLIRQADEEVTHSKSYAVMAEDICKDTKRIYNMFKHDEELRRKNQAVIDMYKKIYITDNKITDSDLLLACGANQILEELVFPGGFAGMYLLGEKMVGSAEMIKEINCDETLSHVPLFRNIFRTIVKENFGGIIPENVVNTLLIMIEDMVKAENRWSTYALRGIVGGSPENIRSLVVSQANSISDNLMIRRLYKEPKINPLKDLILSKMKGSSIRKRAGFFEVNPTDYDSNGVIDF